MSKPIENYANLTSTTQNYDVEDCINFSGHIQHLVEPMVWPGYNNQ